VKYCPNRVCPHRRRCRTPAEFLDRIVTCADCGMALIDDPVVAQAGTTPVPPTRGYREPAEMPLADDTAAARARNDVVTGTALILLSLALPVVTYAAALSAGGGGFFVALGPFFYGIYRLERGRKART
jgi:hypothetical protein